MKAYKVYNKYDWDGYQDIVFAESGREAKKQWQTLDSCSDVDYINIRVNRLSFLDGMENRTQEEIRYVAINNGWWYEIGGTRYDEENIQQAIDDGVVKEFSND